MNKYNRYFRVTTGPLIDEIKKSQEINEKACKEYLSILKSIGAENTYYTRENRLISVIFKKLPDTKIYKKIGSGWYPKQNVKIGRELHKRFKAVTAVGDEECLKVVGLPNSPTLFGGGKCYFPTLVIIPSKATVAFVTVPWFDEDPAELEQYVKDREAGTRGDGNLDAILWTPTGDMSEIKEWEFKKEVCEWNESIKSSKAA